MPRINQQALAHRLNLSQTTVSRSLANHPAINAETKALVLETAAKMGYSQPIRRRQPPSVTERSAVWGVLITMPKQFSDPSETFQEVLRGIADKSALHEAILDVVYHDPADDNPAALLRRIRNAHWKGIIFIYPVNPEIARHVANRIASVSIIEKYENQRIDSIDVDQSETILKLAKHLREKGHRKIGFFTWQYSVDAPWVLHRFGSYVEALYRLGLEFDPARCVNLDAARPLEPKAAAETVAGLVRSGVTAFICAADHQAYSLVEDLGKLGLSVPEDVSLTGFDGVQPRPGYKQLATIRVPYEELGRSATHQLVRRIEQPGAPRRHIIVDGELIRGETIASISS
ncbi:MAG: LacI family DNA-binding transcriptional regulator [Oceanipulchritudo sp.]